MISPVSVVSFILFAIHLAGQLIQRFLSQHSQAQAELALVIRLRFCLLTLGIVRALDLLLLSCPHACFAIQALSWPQSDVERHCSEMMMLKQLCSPHYCVS